MGYVTLPATLLPGLIENGDMRALIVIAGNPLLSAGGEARLRKAFEKLDLMVALDIYRSVTAEMSDYALPSTDWLERPDINLMCDGLQAIPYTKSTDAIEQLDDGDRKNTRMISSHSCAARMPPSALTNI